MIPWPEPVERVASFLRATRAEARIEELAADTTTAEAAADAIGCTLGQVVRSLVFMCNGSPLVALVPGDRRADSAKVARLAGVRRAAIARPAEVVAATGFAPGAVAPFSLEGVPVVLVERMLVHHPIVWVGAGSEHHMVALSPRELVRLTRGRVEDLVRESP
jgi:prolyl-tRNA editing enzyme YbaK/EbsC (Cys-tRNA(Pro) deacylase)